jgi:hypothetical protein
LLTYEERELVEANANWIQSNRADSLYNELLEKVEKYNASKRAKSSRSSSSTPQTGRKAAKPESGSISAPIVNSTKEYELKTIGDLQVAVKSEIARRNITSDNVLNESEADKDDDANATFDHFLRTGTVKNSLSGRDMCKKLVK